MTTSASMVLEAHTVVSVPAHSFIKMDDRKRTSPSDHHDDLSPAAKRHAADVKTENSEPAASGIVFGTANTPWQVDLETFQKDALLRNMRELKREKQNLESQLSDMEKRNQGNEEAIRFVQTFVDQLIDEVHVFSGKITSVEVAPKDTSIFSFMSSPHSFVLDLNNVQKQLATRMSAAKEAIEACLSKLPPTPPESRQLSQKLNEVLGQLKIERKKLEATKAELATAENGFMSATERYMQAETRMDRMRSTVVNNLEKQGRMLSVASSESEQVNGDKATASSQVDGEALTKLRTAKDEAAVEAAKRKEHATKLGEENKKLSSEMTALTTRLASLSDEDYAKTELFKASKSQHEDLIKRINHLEATNIQLREEAKKLREDRMAYRKQTDEEAQKTVEESEAALSRLDADLQRIRQERDQLQDKYAIAKPLKPDYRVSLEKMEQMTQAKDSRIAAFEEEIKQLKARLGESTPEATQNGDLSDSLSADELRRKYAALQKELTGLKAEIPHMEEAYTKYHALALKKVNEFQAYENNIAIANAEKAKADQKFFGAMKSKEAREGQIRQLQAQNAKTSALISAFKDEQGKSSELIRNLEKQCAEHQASVEAMTYKEQQLQSQADGAEAKAKALEHSLNELKKTIESKETAAKEAQHAQREAEVELESSKTRLSEVQKKVESLSKKAKSGDPNSDLEMLKRVAYCSSCNRNLKDTMIKTCGHVLCKECVNERITARSRKCPHCLKPFGQGDCVPVHLI